MSDDILNRIDEVIAGHRQRFDPLGGDVWDEDRVDRWGDGMRVRPARTGTEALEDVAIRRIGRDLGTVHRDEMVGAAVAAALRVMADEIDRGPTFPMPPSVISELVRERALGLTEGNDRRV